MPKPITRLNNGLVKCLLIYFLNLSFAFASGTYVPPVTSYMPTNSTTNETTSTPRARMIRFIPIRRQHERKVSKLMTVSENDNVYNMGKEFIFAEHNRSQPPGCSSCHNGANAFSHANLIAKKDKLAEIIEDCNGPHRVYCQGGTSSLTTQKVRNIVYTLKVRYNLGK